MKKARRREEDLIVGYNDENPMGQFIYHPVILNQALIWSVVLAVITGIITYLVARGTLPVPDLGQLSASSDIVAGIAGAGFGLALGGLAGGLFGMIKMLKMGKKQV